MKSFIVIKPALLAITLLATKFVLALPTVDTGSTQDFVVPEGYTAGQIHITGELNGVAINHTGSVQEVFAQLDAEDNSFKLADLAGIQRRTPSVDLEQFAKRYATDLHCLPVDGQTWTGADITAISEGVAYLREGWKMCSVPGRTCGRVSCSWNSAIYICNNKDEAINPTCDLIAAFAKVMADKCRVRRGVFQHDVTGGQFWDNDNWNVIIHSDRC
ncbi:hypothetical protein DL98DRAFT_568950 [Cadophora sp. DSE1049]|nr:hypothetical protein DL98DRAFT_568950 [Cadophora sp. DSE1049]